MSYNNTLRFLADVIDITYKNPEVRPKNIQYQGEELTYIREKSTHIFSHYESDNMILVGVKGVSDVSSLTQAIMEYKLDNSIQTQYVAAVTKKYKELELETKPVYLTGHSLGGYSIVSAASRSSKKFKTFLFAPYLPSVFGNITNEYMNRTHKKIFFTNDPVPFKLLINFYRLTNSIVFSPPSRLSETHSIKNFQQPTEVLNKLIYKVYK